MAEGESELLEWPETHFHILVLELLKSDEIFENRKILHMVLITQTAKKQETVPMHKHHSDQINHSVFERWHDEQS